MSVKVVRERWLVEGVEVVGDKILVRFESRQGDVGPPGVIDQRSISEIDCQAADGGTQVTVSREEGKYYARKLGQYIDVTLEIGCEVPEAAAPSRR